MRMQLKKRMKNPFSHEVKIMGKITVGAIITQPGNSMEYKTGSWRSYKPIIDKEKCKKCGICVTYCPDASIKRTEDIPVIDYDYCKGCGICAIECPSHAIIMKPEV